MSGLSFDRISIAAAIDKPAKRTVTSKVIGIKDGAAKKGLPPMISG
jgi:hypothetical protein